MTPLRTIAFRTLLLVERGGFAADLLHASMGELETRDAALAEEIVFGVLRFQSQLDFLVAYYSGRPAGKLDREVLIALRMGIYQLRYLDRIPAHAAVAESVELVKRAKKSSAAGLVNAVLRKVDRKPVRWPDRATELSHPAWMLERWDRQYGVETATAIAAANLRRPETYLRVPPGQDAPENAESVTEVPGCYRAPLGYGRGAVPGYRIQDIGSQSIVPLLGLRRGETFLDLCAAPGNKTAQALEAGVRAVACDIHPHRLEALRGLSTDLVVLDGTASLPFSRPFRPDPPGRALLGYRHTRPQSRDQMAPPGRGFSGAAGAPDPPAGECTRGAPSRGSTGLLHLLAGARGKRGSGGAIPRCRDALPHSRTGRRRRLFCGCDRIDVAP